MEVIFEARLNRRRVSDAEIRRLWAMIVDHATAKRSPSRCVIDPASASKEGKATIKAILDSLHVDIPTRWPKKLVELSACPASVMVELGPFVRALNIFDGTDLLASIADWGTSIVATFSSEEDARPLLQIKKVAGVTADISLLR